MTLAFWPLMVTKRLRRSRQALKNAQNPLLRARWMPKLCDTPTGMMPTRVGRWRMVMTSLPTVWPLGSQRTVSKMVSP